MHPDLVMQMRAGGPPAAAYAADGLPAPHVLTFNHVDARKVRVESFIAVAVVHHYQTPIAVDAAQLDYRAIRRGLHRSSGRRRNIHARVIRAFARERVIALPKRAHQAALHGPHARHNIHSLLGGKQPGGPPHVRVAVVAQEVVFGQRLRHGGCQARLARNIGWPFQLPLEAVSDRYLACKHL